MIDEKLKKVTTEKAPVAGGGSGSGAGAGAGLTTGQTQSLLSQALGRANGPGGAAQSGESLQDLFARRAAESGQLGSNPFGLPGFGGQDVPGSGSGAAAALGVLAAVDEDNEGDEEATAPEAFEYFTDTEEGDE